jgi:hypothetical protein
MFSKRVFVILAFALMACGSLAIINGTDIVQLERGWTQIISGSIALCSGILLLGIAALLDALHKLTLAQERASERGKPLLMSAPESGFEKALVKAQETEGDKAPAVASAPASVQTTAPERETAKERPSFMAKMAALKPASAPSAPEPQSEPQSEQNSEPRFEPSLPRPPLPPAPTLSLEERLPWKRKKAHEKAQERIQDLDENAPPLPLEHDDVIEGVTYGRSMAVTPPVPPPSQAPAIPPVPPAPDVAIPSAARPKLNELFRKATRPAERFDERPTPPLPPFPPGYKPPKAPEPHDEPPLPEAFMPSAPRLDTALEPEPAYAAPDVALTPEHDYVPLQQPFTLPSHMEAPAPADAAAPAIIMDDVPASSEPHVVGRYEANGTRYALFSDGAIEADTGIGVYRFASITELKKFIDEREAQKRS